MAYTFPLAVNDLFQGLPITTVTFDLGEALQMSQTAGGEVLTADVGNRLWKADIKLAWQYYYEMEEIKAKFNLLRYAGRSLIVHQMPIIAPRSDPNGTALVGYSPYLHTVESNNRDVRFGGLPPNYVLTPGDGFSYQYGTNPVRYAFHQIVQGGVTDVNGFTTDTLEVVPFIQPGYGTDPQVKFIRAEFKAVVVPGSFQAGSSGGQVTDGVSFSLIQTFR